MEYTELVKSLRFVAENKSTTTPVLLTDAADAIEELLKAANAMHTWIFLNSGDERKAYDWCGLSDEMNAALGYSGQFELRAEPPKEKKEEKDDRI